MANLSQEKRIRMLSFLETLRENSRDDVSSIRAINEIEQAINEKKYGLVWELHTERIDNLAENNILIFDEVCSRKITKEVNDPYNFLLEGDNLHSLKLLEKTHRGGVDVIYIDPPYNTKKNDFMYDDKYVEKDDAYIHSKWLSFMSARLKCARNILSDYGIICISIDEKEYSQLKILMDDIFSESNHLSTHHIQVRYQNKSLNEDNDWQPVMEYVLIYAKDKSKFSANKPCEEYDLEKFCYEINELSPGESFVVGGKTVTVFRAGEWKITKVDNPGIGYLKETWASGSIVRQSGTAAEFLDKYLLARKEIDGLGCLYKIDNMGEDGLGYRYVSGPKKANAIRGKFYSGVPTIRIKEIESGTAKKTRPIPNFYDFSADVGNIRHEGGVAFNGGKKPIRLLKQLINYHPSHNSVVLDFFAGSGSTGHAVIELNKQDGGKRRYILCTNNENDICEKITYQRLLNIQVELPHNLKYFKTGLIEKREAVPITYELLDHIKPLIELQYACNVENSSMRIFLTEDDFDDFMESIEVVDLTKIFLASDILLSADQVRKLEASNCQIFRIPEYYYRTELIESGDI
jgi:adenine specific DNA methylase mod